MKKYQKLLICAAICALMAVPNMPSFANGSETGHNNGNGHHHDDEGSTNTSTTNNTTNQTVTSSVTGGNATTTSGSANTTGGTANVTGGTSTTTGGIAQTTSGSANTTGGTATTNSGNNSSSASAKGGAGGSGGSANGVVTTNTSVNTKNEVAASSAYAPALSSSNDTCMGSSSVGGQGVGFGLSLGTTWTDEDCVRRKDAVLLDQIGLREAALALMCQKADIQVAIAKTGDKKLIALCGEQSGDGVTTSSAQTRSNSSSRTVSDYSNLND